MLTSTQLIYKAAGYPLVKVHDGKCAVCGGVLFSPTPLKEFLKSTFTDHDKLKSGSDLLCAGCSYCWTEYNPDVQRMTGKEGRQKFRNYSHFVLNGEWSVFSKAHKRAMNDILLKGVMPEVAIIAVSGQKHLAIKSRSNPEGELGGWLMYEELHVDFSCERYAKIEQMVNTLYQAGYTKDAILNGRYTFYPDSNIALWKKIEPELKALRGDLHLEIAVYLASKDEEKDDDGTATTDV